MFYFIPQAALAGVIIMAVMDMVDFQLVKTLWRVKSKSNYTVYMYKEKCEGLLELIGVWVGCDLTWLASNLLKLFGESNKVDCDIWKGWLSGLKEL